MFAAVDAGLEEETALLVSRWLHQRGLHEAARAVWLHAAARAPDSGGHSDCDSDSAGQRRQRPSYPPPLPHPTLPDDALRLILQQSRSNSAQPAATRRSLAQPANCLRPPRPPLCSSLPPSLFHSGTQSVLPFFRCHPLHAVRTPSSAESGVGEERIEAESSGRSSQPSYLRALSYLSSLPSLAVRSGLRVSSLSSSSLLPSFRCLKRLYGHLCPVFSVVFDVSGDFFFTGSDDHLVKVWSARSGRLLWTLRGHSHEVTDIAVSPDNAILASASWDHSIRIWQLQRAPQPLHVFFHQHSNKIWRIAFHPHYRPGHRLLFSASMDGSTQIFDLDNCSSRTVTLFANPLHLSLPNTLTALTADEAARRGYLQLLLPTLTSADRQQPMPAVDPQPSQQQQQLSLQPEERMLEVGSSVAGSGGSEAAPPIAALPPPLSAVAPEVLSISHHPDGSEFALGSNDRCIRVYRMEDKQLVATLSGHAGEIDHLFYDHLGNRLLGVDDEGECLIWERISERALRQQLDSDRQHSASGEAKEAPAGELNSSALSANSASSELHRSPSASPPAVAEPLRGITRFQCVGRLRVLVGLSSQPFPPPASNFPAYSCKLMSACWSLTDRYVLTSSSDHCVRVWTTPPVGTADDLFAAECDRARQSGQRDDVTGSVLLPTSQRSFLAHVPLLQPTATLCLHSGDVAVLRPHPRLTSVLLTAGHDGRVAVWDVDERRLLRLFACKSQAKPTGPSDAQFVDGAWSPAGDMCALSDDDGEVWLFGLGSRLAYQLAPAEQFYQSDYAPITLDSDGWVIDSNSQLPPHLMPDRTATVIQASGQPYEPQPRSGTAPDRFLPSCAASNTASVSTGVDGSVTVQAAAAGAWTGTSSVRAFPSSDAVTRAVPATGRAVHMSPFTDTATAGDFGVPDCATAAVVLQADTVRASLLAALRAERRQRWQRTAAQAGEAAGYQRHADVEGGDELWNEHFDSHSGAQLHFAADVEHDLADSDDTLDGTEQRTEWEYDIALAAQHTRRTAHSALPLPQQQALDTAPTGSVATDLLTVSTVEDEAYSEWRRAQRLLQSELSGAVWQANSAADEWAQDNEARFHGAIDGSSQPVRGLSRVRVPPPSSPSVHPAPQHAQPYQLRARESAQSAAAVTAAAALLLEESTALSAEQAAIDAVVARDIRAVQRAERRAQYHPDGREHEQSAEGWEQGEAADSGEVGEDTPLQSRVRAAALGGGSTRRRNERYGSSSRHSRSRRAAGSSGGVEYKEDDWDLPLDGNSDSDASGDGGEWREEDDRYGQSEEEEGEGWEERRAADSRRGEEHSSSPGSGRRSRARRRRSSSRPRRALLPRHDGLYVQPQQAEQFAVDATSPPSSEQSAHLVQQQQPVRSSHRLASQAQMAHTLAALAAEAEAERYLSLHPPPPDYYSRYGRRSKRPRDSDSVSEQPLDAQHNASGLAQAASGTVNSGEYAAHGHSCTQAQSDAAEYEERKETASGSPVDPPAPRRPTPCRHERGDEYALIAHAHTADGDDGPHGSHTAAAQQQQQLDEEKQPPQPIESEQREEERKAVQEWREREDDSGSEWERRAEEARADSGSPLRIRLRRLPQREWSELAVGDKGKVEQQAEWFAGLRRGRSRMRLTASPTEEAVAVPCAALGKRVRIMCGGRQVGTIDM